MKKIYISILVLATLSACNNSPKTENAEEPKTEETVVTEGTKSEATATEEPEKKELSMEDLAGNWEQKETASGGGMSVSAKLTVKLKADGTFESSQSAMGVNSSQAGKWSLEGKTVNLKGLEKLEYDENTQTLVNAKEHIALEKK
jgi:hypothetical protein